MTDQKHHKLWLLSPGLNFKQVVVAQLREHDILILILLVFWRLSSQLWLWDSLPYSSIFEAGLNQIRAKKPRADCLAADGSGRRGMKGALGMQAGVCQFCLLLALQTFLAGETNDRHQSVPQEPSEISTALPAALLLFLSCSVLPRTTSGALSCLRHSTPAEE